MSPPADRGLSAIPISSSSNHSRPPPPPNHSSPPKTPSLINSLPASTASCPSISLKTTLIPCYQKSTGKYRLVTTFRKRWSPSRLKRSLAWSRCSKSPSKIRAQYKKNMPALPSHNLNFVIEDSRNLLRKPTAMSAPSKRPPTKMWQLDSYPRSVLRAFSK